MRDLLPQKPLRPKKPAYRTISARVSPEFYALFCQIRDKNELTTQGMIIYAIKEAVALGRPVDPDAK